MLFRMLNMGESPSFEFHLRLGSRPVSDFSEVENRPFEQEVCFWQAIYRHFALLT